MKRGWFRDYHRHYLAAKYGAARKYNADKDFMYPADLLVKSNQLGQSFNLKDSFEKGSEITPHAAHEGSEVLPRAFAFGEDFTGKWIKLPVMDSAKKSGERDFDKVHHTSTHYLAKEPKYEHVPSVKTKKQEYEFEEKTGRRHEGEPLKTYLERPAGDEDESI